MLTYGVTTGRPSLKAVSRAPLDVNGRCSSARKRSGRGRRRRGDPRRAIRPHQPLRHRSQGHSFARPPQRGAAGQSATPRGRESRRAATWERSQQPVTAGTVVIAEPLCRRWHLRLRNNPRTGPAAVTAEALCRQWHLRLRNRDQHRYSTRSARPTHGRCGAARVGCGRLATIMRRSTTSGTSGCRWSTTRPAWSGSPS
jgi:hypothetical protein